MQFFDIVPRAFASQLNCITTQHISAEMDLVKLAKDGIFVSPCDPNSFLSVDVYRNKVPNSQGRKKGIGRVSVILSSVKKMASLYNDLKEILVVLWPIMGVGVL